MAVIATPGAYSPIDPVGACKNWTQKASGAQARMGNRAVAMQQLAHAVNRALSRFPRIHASKAQPIAQADTAGSDPLYVWRIDDIVDNARSYTVTVLALPRATGSGSCYAGKYGGSEATPTADALYLSPALVDVFEAEYQVTRGAVTDAEANDGISTYNGYTVLDVVVQDDEISSLDTALHQYCNPALAHCGEKVLADIAEQIRAAFHEQRTTNLPIWGWCGQAYGGSWATPAVSNHRAIVINSSTYVNVLDQSVTSRTATSPGCNHVVQYCGLGASDETIGKQLKCYCRVFAAVDGGVSNGEVKFIGPTHVASNDITIAVTPGVAAAWYGNSSSYLYLNGSSTPTDTGTTRNKIDIHAKVATAPTNTLYIYAIKRWLGF